MTRILGLDRGALSEHAKNWLLVVAVSTVTLAIALGMIRWFAPGLLGVPTDLQLVKVSEEVAPFLEGVFRPQDYAENGFLIRDPQLVSRARPLLDDHMSMGPHDILGFRNRSVPNLPDVVTIGDSQTYGNNTMLERNWPSRLAAHMSGRNPVVYNMSCGAWDGPQYLEVLDKALYFRPRILVVAFYTGNDPIGAFITSYGSERWADLRLDPELSKEDAPRVAFPAPPSEQWPVKFGDGSGTVFTPQLRLVSNREDDPAARTGWRILRELARRAAARAQAEQVGIVFTVIPTKELVYAPRVRAEGLEMPEAYAALVTSEERLLTDFGAYLATLPGARYVDVLDSLQEAAADGTLYPPNADGHPVASGYDVIARALAPVVEELLPDVPEGLVFMESPLGGFKAALVRDGEYWVFSSIDVLRGNGWKSQRDFHVAKIRDMAGLRFRGEIDSIDRARFGPPALAAKITGS